MAKRGRPPLSERRDLAARLRAAGLTLQEVGRELGVTKQAALYLLRAAQGRQMRGAPRPATGVRRPWTADEDGLVRLLPPGEAAARTGRSVSAVYNRRHGLGLARRRPAS